MIVAVKRGEKEIIPNGSLKSGDYLVILSEEDMINKLYGNLRKLCRK